MKKLAIFGAGSLAREIAELAQDCGYQNVSFVVDDEYVTATAIDGYPVIPFSQIEIENFVWLIAVQDSHVREKVVKKIRKNAKFATFIHPTAIVRSNSQIGEGVIIGPNAYISINVKIAPHSTILRGTILGHDSEINEFSSVMPGAVISGNSKIGKHVFLGANSSLKEGTIIEDRTVVGMGTVVITNLSTGVYVGNPARKIS
jgi:sugar O-acyltransferase (sialic acid O-acetyltransferase NeuD family)